MVDSQQSSSDVPHLTDMSLYGVVCDLFMVYMVFLYGVMYFSYYIFGVYDVFLYGVFWCAYFPMVCLPCVTCLLYVWYDVFLYSIFGVCDVVMVL